MKEKNSKEKDILDFQSSHEFQLLTILCQLAIIQSCEMFSNSGLIDLLNSSRWKQATSVVRLQFLDQQYIKDFMRASPEHQKRMAEIRKKIDATLKNLEQSLRK